MARVSFETFAPAAVVGMLSAAANVVEKQALNKEKTTGKPPGALFGNASLWGDLAIGAYAVMNYTDMAGAGWFPRQNAGTVPGEARAAMAGAGMALIARRASDYIGASMLKLPTGGGRHTAIPGRSMMGRALRSPSAAVETSILPRKRQFFSVT